MLYVKLQVIIRNGYSLYNELCLYLEIAKRTRTPITAAKGTAIIKPKNPSRTPPASKANITHTG